VVCEPEAAHTEAGEDRVPLGLEYPVNCVAKYAEDHGWAEHYCLHDPCIWHPPEHRILERPGDVPSPEPEWDDAEPDESQQSVYECVLDRDLGCLRRDEAHQAAAHVSEPQAAQPRSRHETVPFLTRYG
jgi:hypothetical protein